MYRQFVVKNFRRLRDLRLETLGRVNLLAGRNNVGKTTLLEALFLHIGSHNPELSMRLSGWRGMAEVPLDIVWSLLFSDLDTDKTIEFNSIDTLGHSRSLRVRTLSPQDIDLSAQEFAPATFAGPATTDARIRGLVSEYEDSTGKTGESKLLLGPNQSVMIRQPAIPAQPVGVFLGSQLPWNPQEAPERFTALERKGGETKIVQMMRIMEPRLTRLSVGVLAGKAVIMGDVQMRELVPISVLGDGLNRLLAVLLAIYSAPQGYVLVDEIENGLHYSALKDVWTAIAGAAQESNVQVFATTHSLECARAAHLAFSEIKAYDFRLHRLEMTGDEVTAVTFSQDALQAAIDYDWEVR